MNRVLVYLFSIVLMPMMAPAAESEFLELNAEQAYNAKLTTTRVSAEEHPTQLNLSGILSADRRKSHRVAPVMEGMVSKLHVIENARVRKGQMLATLRSSSLGQAQADYLNALARFEFAQSERSRIEGLWKDGIIAESRWLKADSEYKSARAEFETRRYFLSLAGLSHRQIQALPYNSNGVAEFTLVSPIDGMITKVEVEPGQSLAAGETAFQISDSRTLWVMVRIPVDALPQIKVGTHTGVRVQARPDKPYLGRLESLGGEVDTESQTLAGRIVVNNADGLLRPGMFAEIRLSGGVARGLSVPDSAVFRVNDRTYVFRVVGSRRYAPVAVSIGASTGAGVAITRGLAAGDEIVSGGVAELKSHWQYQGGK